jgi:hypothetical protein
MSKPIVRHLIVVLALSAFLGSPAISLAGPRHTEATARHAQAQAAAQSPLSRLRTAVIRIWEKTGCAIEPYGHCLPATTPGSVDGCSVGPDGQCMAGTSALTAIIE